VHFACHGEVDEQTELLSRLRFRVGGADLILPLMWLAPLKVAGAGAPRGPLVFLNACSTNQPAAGSFSFPQAWIDAGAAAVVATLCPVPDDFALLFAEEFYKRLLSGGRYARVAETLLDTRRHFMQHYNNPLGLAYVLYARRGTHVVPRGAREEAP
jgi:CHAT domain-containing protein